MPSDMELLAALGLWHELEHTPRTASRGWWLRPLARRLAAIFRRRTPDEYEPDVLPGLWLPDEDEWRLAA